MEFLMYLFELWIGDVRIDLGGREIFVAKEFLDRTKVCTIPEKICRERVTERVW
jgi:hypothetical protein